MGPEFLRRALGGTGYLGSEFVGGRRNCHVSGLDSVVLWDERELGGPMVRFFYAHPDCPMRDLYRSDGHFILGVHNHRYNLLLLPLFGDVCQVAVTRETDARSHPLYEYAFESGLTGQMSAKLQGRITARMQDHWMRKGDVCFMEAEELHTVRVGGEAAWVVVESPDVPGVESRIFSRRPDLTLSAEGLYDPMTPEESRALTEYVLSRSNAELASSL